MTSPDPMHIDNVRARRAADGAERAMWRAIREEIDGPPVTLVGMLRRALFGEPDPDGGGEPVT